MNFGGSRLGFWFVPLGPPRTNFSKKVLVFYDNYTNVDGNTDYYNSGDVNPGTDLWPVIRDQEIGLGNEPELVVGYTNLGNLNQYGHIWDIGYASPYASNPTYDPTNQLLAYMQFGGAMFILGENASGFLPRDDTIDVFVGDVCGGGTVTRSGTDYNYAVNATVEPEFLIANNNNSVTFDRPGTFLTYGTGTPMSTAFSGSEYVAVCWKTGSLANAGRGAITSVLDVNFFLASSYSYNPDFIANLSATLTAK